MSDNESDYLRDDDFEYEDDDDISFESDNGSLENDSLDIDGDGDVDINDHLNDENDASIFKPSSDGESASKNSVLSSINNNDNVKVNLYNYSKYTLIQFIHKVLFPNATNVSSILNLTQNQTFYLLIHFKWNFEGLVEQYMEKYNILLDEIGIPLETAPFIIPALTPTPNGTPSATSKSLGKLEDHGKDFVCPICCNDDDETFGETKKFALTCGHYYCQDCYKHYVNDQIPLGTLIKCPEYDCSRRFQLEDLNILFQNEYQKRMDEAKANFDIDTKRKKYKKLFKKYHSVSFGQFVGDNSDSDDDSDFSDNFDESGDIYTGSPRRKSVTIASTDSNVSGSDAKSFAPDFLYDVADNENYTELIKEEETMMYHQKCYDYLKFVAKKYIESHKNIHWCPAPDCDTLVQFNQYVPDKAECATKITQLPIITCMKEHNFCVNCKYENHYPVPCHVVEKWVEKCNNDSETANWINLNTKQCPKCFASIEKNGGCNHMTCNKCSHQFCWICSGPWSLHANEYYKCNRYDESEAKETRNSLSNARKNYTKYLHYFDRFQIHQVSMNQDLRIYEKISKKIKLLQNTQGISWIEGQFLKNSISTLLKARNTLKWSYAFSYFLKDVRTNSAIIFEQMQTSLSNAVEDLSKLFEISDPKKIIAERLQFIQKARFCVSRQLSLISCAEEGLVKGALVFDTETAEDSISKVQHKKNKR